MLAFFHEGLDSCNLATMRVAALRAARSGGRWTLISLSRSRSVRTRMGIVGGGDTPAVLQKSAEPVGGKGVVKRSCCKERQESAKECGRRRMLSGRVGIEDRITHPLFFVSVASKRFTFSVSRLFSALARGSICVAFKGVRSDGRIE